MPRLIRSPVPRPARVLLSGALLAFGLAAPASAAPADWPQFRGPTQQGHADATGLPVEWSETRNVKWRTPIPGEGWSSPVVLGQQVWLTTATEEGRSLRAVCADRESGKIVHDVEVFRVASPEPKNEFNSYASPTPVVEAGPGGGRVYVSFGTYGNACLDAATGRPVWKNEDLKLNHKEGPGSSPVVYKDLFVLHCDGMDVQYVAALDKQTGKLRWKAPRSKDFSSTGPDLRKAYNIPLVLTVGGKDILISVGAKRAYAYDPADGREVWTVDLPGFSNVPRPVYGDGVVYLSTGYMQPELWAVRVDPAAKGDITATHVLWKHRPGAPAKPSVLLADGKVYVPSDNGIARCLDAKTGEQVWQGRLGRAITASPIYADGRIYFFTEDGDGVVVRPGDRLDVVATNKLDGRVLASPAVSGKALLVRTDKALYRIEN